MSAWAFYGRVSGQEQSTNNSLPTQREACHQRAQAKGAIEILDFVDAGVPGDLAWTDRPALSQLLDLVEQKRVSGVVIYDPDRLARDLGVQLAVTELITKNAVQLEFITQEYNASPEGMLFYQLRGAVSQFEKAKIRERTLRGKRKLLKDGKPHNPVSIYGVGYDKETNCWVVKENEAEVVRQIFRWRALGWGPTRIANELNRLGVPTPRGAYRWWMRTVDRMVRNPAYSGTLHVNRLIMEGVHKNKYLPEEKRVRPKVRPESEWVELQVPAIIDQGLWNSVQAIEAEGQRKWAGRTPSLPYLASRIIACGLCGSRLHGATANRTARGKGRVRYYRCAGRFGERRMDCAMPHLVAEEVDRILWMEVRAWLVSDQRYKAALQRAQQAEERLIPESRELVTQLTAVRTDLARLDDLIANGIIKEIEVRSHMRTLREREATLAAKLQAPPEPPSAEDFPPLPPDLVDQFSHKERREYFLGLVAQVIAYPDGRLEITPHKKARLPKS